MVNSSEAARPSNGIDRPFISPLSKHDYHALIHRPLLKHLYLTGYRGTGKTSVATRLAAAIGCPVIDLDARIQSHAGCSIREIFADSGEQGFRDLESEMLSVVATEPPAVVALGGGAILRESNRELIQSSGQCVWLIATAETLAMRIAADTGTTANRPALTPLGHLDEIRQLLLTRQPHYEDAANAQVDTTDKSIEQVSDEILAVCRDRQWC